MKSIDRGTVAVLGVLLSAGLMGCEESDATFVEHLAIVNINPSHGAVGIGYGTAVTVTFSGELVADESVPPQLPAGAACLTSDSLPPVSAADPCAGGGTVPAEPSYEAATSSLRLVPDESLLPDERYTVHLTPLIEGKEGGPLSAVVRASFRTIPTN